MPDQTPPPGDDWAFPTVEPAPHLLPAESGMESLLGWVPEPALPAPVPAPAYDPPPPSTPDWSTGTGTGSGDEAPSAGVMPVPRRNPAAAAPISPLRALAGAAVAVAGVLLGIGALLWATDAPKGSPTLQQTQAQSSVLTSPSPTLAAVESPSSAPAAVAPAPVVRSAAPSPAAAPKLALTVLNNSNRTGLAKRAAARYAAAGWPIKLTGSFRGRVSETTAYFAPGQQASALALQKAFPAITRVRPRFAGLPGSGLTVVLIRTYPA